MEEKYAFPYVVYLPEGHMYLHDIQLYQDAEAKVMVDQTLLYE